MAPLTIALFAANILLPVVEKMKNNCDSPVLRISLCQKSSRLVTYSLMLSPADRHRLQVAIRLQKHCARIWERFGIGATSSHVTREFSAWIWAREDGLDFGEKIININNRCQCIVVRSTLRTAVNGWNWKEVRECRTAGFFFWLIVGYSIVICYRHLLLRVCSAHDNG